METINQIIEQSLKDIDNSVNEKIIGVNFLELSKFELCKKLFDLDNNILDEIQKSLVKEKIFEKKIELLRRSINYKIQYYEKSLILIKKKIDNDNLYIMLQGLLKLSIIDKYIDKKSMNFNLSKNMCVVLSQDTVLSEEFIGNSIILSLSSN